MVVGVCYAGYCLAWLYMHDYTQAVEWGRKAIRQPVVPWLAYAYLIPALAHSGDVEEAKLVSKKLQNVQPDISISFIKDRIHTVHEESLKLLLEGFRKAGWEG